MKNNRDKDPTQDALQAAAGSKIDAIKEIIFGQNIREYDEEFVKVRDELEVAQKSADARVGELEKQLLDRIASLEKNLAKQMESNHKQLVKEVEQLSERKTDRKELGKLLIQLGTKLSA